MWIRMLYFAAQTIKDLRMKVLICSLCLALGAICLKTYIHMVQMLAGG